MRTALILLLSLALAAIPGSLFPQRGADPNGVIQWERDNPELFPFLDAIGLFDVYYSAWFSSIYLLLFVSLIGCVIPRAKHHFRALRGQPPRTPIRFARLPEHLERTIPSEHVTLAETLDLAETELTQRRYRVRRYEGKGWTSVSAERGYLRETGNLLFHIALVGVLVSVVVGKAFAYTGQRVVVEGTTFVNTLSDFSSFDPGRFADGTNLTPYSLTLDRFDVTYQPAGAPGGGQAGDFAANVTVRSPGADDRTERVVVNYPITVGTDRVHLLGNGYAPTLTVRDAEGRVVYSDSLPFLPQDSNMTSLGVVKVPDGLPQQVGLIGFFYPTQDTLPSGAATSIYPDVINPVITLNAFAGDLGIDDGTPRSVYSLEVDELTQLTGGDTGQDSIELRPGSTSALPNEWGTITWERADGAPVKRFASLQIQRDPSSGWVLAFSVLACVGLFTGLLIPRRRLWVKVHSSTTAGSPIRVEYAGLARGDDPGLGRAVRDLADSHAHSCRSSTTLGRSR
ncbi:cytochrome c biogenesis protein ResB [Microbacterium sp.]|uniref:cytochrome c biogenesis protein ResB n=1 Tax=Microbacterium sp. TaxID=51671 RepID=UPI00341FB94A